MLAALIHYLRNRSTSDVGTVVLHRRNLTKERSPEA
jgi:hypothetical protein